MNTPIKKIITLLYLISFFLNAQSQSTYFLFKVNSQSFPQYYVEDGPYPFPSTAGQELYIKNAYVIINGNTISLDVNSLKEYSLLLPLSEQTIEFTIQLYFHGLTWNRPDPRDNHDCDILKDYPQTVTLNSNGASDAATINFTGLPLNATWSMNYSVSIRGFRRSWSLKSP